MDHTSLVAVIAERKDIKSIKFEGLKFFIEFDDGVIAEYKYEFINHIKKGDIK